MMARKTSAAETRLIRREFVGSLLFVAPGPRLPAVRSEVRER